MTTDAYLSFQEALLVFCLIVFQMVRNRFI